MMEELPSKPNRLGTEGTGHGYFQREQNPGWGSRLVLVKREGRGRNQMNDGNASGALGVMRFGTSLY